METYTLDIKGGLPVKLTAEHTLGDLEGIDKKMLKPHWGTAPVSLKERRNDFVYGPDA